MPVQEGVIDRIAQIIPGDCVASITQIRHLFEEDEDSFYKLAMNGLPNDAPIGVRGLEWLARTISVLVRDGFFIETAANQKYARGHQGGILSLDNGREDEIFLQQLHTGSDYSSKLESKLRSKECLDFFLKEHPWDGEVRSTMLLRVAPEDAAAILGGLPKYHYYGLLDSAREVVRCPAAVYRGLRHEGKMKAEGWAFCGRPSRWHMNDGSAKSPSLDFVFVVFVSPSGYVFDWDWVPASKENPNLPRDVDDRFSGTHLPDVHAELLVGNLRGKVPEPFQAQRAWFSRQGDCVFWYHDDIETYAGREDEYLTAFFQVEGDNKNKCVGFKLKMVSRLIETVSRWAHGPDECIEISFDKDAVRVDLAFLMKAWVDANLPHSKELFPGMRLVERLGMEAVRALQDETPKFDIPRDVLSE